MLDKSIFTCLSVKKLLHLQIREFHHISRVKQREKDRPFFVPVKENNGPWRRAVLAAEAGLVKTRQGHIHAGAANHVSSFPGIIRSSGVVKPMAGVDFADLCDLNSRGERPTSCRNTRWKWFVVLKPLALATSGMLLSEFTRILFAISTRILLVKDTMFSPYTRLKTRERCWLFMRNASPSSFIPEKTFTRAVM